ncbi:hypothetical protein ACO0LM_13685 [Undibacterium sp. Di26W]|uniref:hypothetical protein n=1 Tax=Undibacterium sp. Di26W TaxID=3413035 RepID=UPI003BEFEC16
MQKTHSVKVKTVAKSTVVKSVLISLLRQPGQIVAILSDEIDGVLQPGFRPISLSELDTRLFPHAASLLADWVSLQNAGELSNVWPAFWRVFWMTIPDPANVVAATTPQVETVKKPVATAANPRAFRGTKYQPPKPAQPDFDLCTWLADQRLLDAFFARHDFVNSPVLDAQGQLISLAADQVPSSAALFFGHWKMPVQGLPVFSDGFRRYFLWQLRTSSTDQQLAWLQIWHSHNSMQADDEWRSENLYLLAHMCALDVTQCHGAELAQLLPVNRQNIFLRLLILEVQGRLSVQQMNPEQLMRLHELTEDGARFEYYLGNVLRNLSWQVSVEYSLAGCLLFEMSGEIDLSSFRLVAMHDCKEELIDIIMQACGCARIRMHSTLWRACGELPGLAQLLRETCWGKLTAQTADNLINVIFQFRWLDDDANRLAKWGAYLQVYPRFHTALIQLTGEVQEKLVLLWYQLIDGLNDNAEICATVEDALPLMQMLAQPPYSNNIDYGYALPNLITYLPVHLRRALPDLGRHFWYLFERACRRENDTRLLAFGIAGMAELSPALLWQGLQSAAPRLFHTLRLLGSLEYERRLQFMREQMQTDWFACDWAALDLQTANRKMLALSKMSKLDSPLPRRLRLHFEGEITLTDMQVQRHCRLTLARLPALRLRALEQAIWHDMDKSFQLREQSPSAHHALQLLAGLDSRPSSNRKGLRRFLQNTKAGKPLSYLDHPLNLDWYAAHPRVNKAQWQTGLQKTTIVDGASVQLAFERDPFEILKLGTYVGSCLSVGGFCNYSAVACLLDANKQVIYARNEKGVVIARQLVAIDEKDRLFCCAVYPYQCSPAMRAAFKAYDQELADLLGLELYREKEDSSYDVATVLAQCWWDDGLWSEE